MSSASARMLAPAALAGEAARRGLLVWLRLLQAMTTSPATLFLAALTAMQMCIRDSFSSVSQA